MNEVKVVTELAPGELLFDGWDAPAFGSTCLLDGRCCALGWLAQRLGLFTTAEIRTGGTKVWDAVTKHPLVQPITQALHRQIGLHDKYFRNDYEYFLAINDSPEDYSMTGDQVCVFFRNVERYARGYKYESL